MKKIFALMLAMALLLSGCADITLSFDKFLPSSTGNTQEPTRETEQPKPTEATAPKGEAELVSLRQAMVETPQAFAVAYLGYCENEDPIALMQENAPQLCADLPFLTGIPKERIIGKTGELYCIVPADTDYSVSVSLGAWDEKAMEYRYEESLYQSKSGEPIVLLCNAGWEPDTQVIFTEPGGANTIWYPMRDDNHCIMPLRNEAFDDLFFDFSPYRELLKADYENLRQEDWGMPTEEMLIGNTWQWAGFLKDGREVSYQLHFEADTLSILWHDGIDTEAHSYADAPWTLSYEKDYALLAIDFKEFAGILCYDLMYNPELKTLYLGMDVLQEDMNIGWEPLYRFMAPVSAPNPGEMIGIWEAAWSEVEGERTEIPANEKIIVITAGKSEENFQISYTDSLFPEDSFNTRELQVCSGELYYSCGNSEWLATVAHVGRHNESYSLTLPGDGTLLVQIYWEMDGAPCVAYQSYTRVE